MQVWDGLCIFRYMGIELGGLGASMIAAASKSVAVPMSGLQERIWVVPKVRVPCGSPRY